MPYKKQSRITSVHSQILFCGLTPVHPSNFSYQGIRQSMHRAIGIQWYPKHKIRSFPGLQRWRRDSIDWQVIRIRFFSTGRTVFWRSKTSCVIRQNIIIVDPNGGNIGSQNQWFFHTPQGFVVKSQISGFRVGFSDGLRKIKASKTE